MSFAMHLKVAELWQGVVGISSYAELGAEFPNSLLPRVAEAGGGSDQIDEFRPHGQPSAAVLRRWKPSAMAPIFLFMVAYCGRCNQR